jgi:hypothetical protein
MLPAVSLGLGARLVNRWNRVASRAVEWGAEVRTSHPRENRWSCLPKTLRSPLVAA